MKADQILRVVRDSDDLGLDAGTLLRVVRVHGRTMDVETLDCEIMIAGVACDHADLGPVRYRWTLEIELDPTLVADGADLSDPRQLERLLERAYPHAYAYERSVRMIAEPDPEVVAREMGYASAAARGRK